jgi:dihydroorotase-like cyclic amidohydrolase
MVVTADRSYQADVKIENGVITQIGENLSGDETLMPGAMSCQVVSIRITHLKCLFRHPFNR